MLESLEPLELEVLEFGVLEFEVLKPELLDVEVLDVEVLDVEVLGAEVLGAEVLDVEAWDGAAVDSTLGGVSAAANARGLAATANVTARPTHVSSAVVRRAEVRKASGTAFPVGRIISRADFLRSI